MTEYNAITIEVVSKRIKELRREIDGFKERENNWGGNDG